MVIVYIGAGLANRMFQYAFALTLKERGIDVHIDEHSFKPQYDFENTKLSNVFTNISLPESPTKQFKYVLKHGFMAKCYKKLSYFFPDYRYIERWKLGYDPEIYNKITENCILAGYWISPKYLDICENRIKNAFIFKNFISPKNIAIAKEMQDVNSVAVHFRKNVDYLSNNLYDGTCTIEYYKKALNYIKEHVKSPVFYFFSDNWEWVNKNIKGITYIPVNWNPPYGEESHCDMQLMSNAKYNIIANSTYSWWAAWLNRNNNKIVIAPQKWFGDDSYFDLDPNIVPSTWKKL
jgi:hypothetical protein